jgi:hypothetical protein
MNYEAPSTTTTPSSVRNKNGKPSGKGAMSYVVCGDKASRILWGCIEDEVYVPPLANNHQGRKEMIR